MRVAGHRNNQERRFSEFHHLQKVIKPTFFHYSSLNKNLYSILCLDLHGGHQGVLQEEEGGVTKDQDCKQGEGN